MLDKLRQKLTLTSTLITASILILISICAFEICKSNLNKRSELMLQSQIDMIAYRLQTEQSITQAWLAETETTNNLIIVIEDNGVPLLFQGAYKAATNRSKLVDEVKDMAENLHDFSLYSPRPSKLDIPRITFNFKTPLKEHFLTSVAIVPSSHGQYTLILMKDLKNEDLQILHIQWLFMGSTLIGSLLLALFSTVFVKNILKPIAINQQKQTDFIAAVSHELRSPIAVLQTFIPAIRTSPEPTKNHFLTLMEKECVRMKNLVNDLLLLTTADTHTWSIHFEKVEIDTILLDLYDTLLLSASQKHKNLCLDLPDSLLRPLSIDHQKFRQILTLLIDNALYYTPDNSTITIRLYEEASYTYIKVIDHGPGIPDDKKALVFDRFYRLDTSRQDKTHHGLGLSIAYEIMRLHHGEILLENTIGGGCTFVLKFPHKACA